ncbi:MAG: conjugal transfer protein TrbL family protein [Ruminococcus sp.]
MFGVPRGYTDGFYSWCKQVIATCLTAFLQTTILYIGLADVHSAPYYLLWAYACRQTEVPRIAQMYGLDTSVRVNMMSVSHTVSMGAKAVGMLKHNA